MKGIAPEGLPYKGGYRIRVMKALLDQIRADYASFEQLCKEPGNAPFGITTESELLRLMGWLKQEINIYKNIKCVGIEGVSCVEIDEIERNVQTMELVLKTKSMD